MRHLLAKSRPLVLSMALCFPAFQAHAAGEAFAGTWDGTAGDKRVDEQWRISNVNGKWAVSGYYYWSPQGVAEDGGRTAGALAGKFEGANVRLENGALKFTQKFSPKPIANWADDVEIEAQVARDTVTFRNRWVSGVKLERARKAADCR